MKIPLRHDLSKGPVLLAVFGVFMLTVLDSIAKELGTRHPTIDVVAMRYVSGVAWSFVLALILRPPMPTLAMVRAHAVRAVFFALTSYLFFYALSTLPLVETMVFSYLSPIFMALFALVLLHEKLHSGTVLAISLSFLGVILTAIGRGFDGSGLLFHWTGMLAALGSAATYALSMVLLRARTGSDTIGIIVVLQNVLTALIVVPIDLSFGGLGDALIMDWPLVILIGLLGTCGQVALARALRAAPAARIGTVEYTSMVWATVIGIVVFGEWPALTAYLGAALIVGGSLILLRRSRALPEVAAASPV